MRDLSQAEFEVMDVLWRKGSATVRAVKVELGKKLAYTTVATLLNRLREKGYVEVHEGDPAHEFRPLVPRESVVRRKLDDLVKNLFRGDVAPLAVYLAKIRNLTPEQIKALEEMIESSEKEETK